MRLLCLRFGTGSTSGKSSCRASTVVSLVLYVGLIALVKVYRVPLKSSDVGQTGTDEEDAETTRAPHQDGKLPRTGNANIIEYLHKLHNLKGNPGEGDGLDKDKDIIRPFYIVEEVFRKADYDHDNYLGLNELSNWINAKTQEHIHEAIVENYKTFLTIDIRPKNGLISWKEYNFHFLRENGFNESFLDMYEKRHGPRSLERIRMDRKLTETLMRDKAAWSESAKNDPDHLTLDEFLSFKHPESSYSMLISLVDEIFKKFDRDGDETLTEDEFSTFQSDEDDYEKQESVNQEESERRKEFREMVDLNNDGKATRREVLTYIDPKNPRHAKEEAETLIGLADHDKDGRLSLHEIFNKIDLFLGSKMIDTARSFHDEL